MSEKNKNEEFLNELGERTQEFIEQKTGGKELIEDFSSEKLVDLLKESPELTEKLEQTKQQLKEALRDANGNGGLLGYKLQLTTLQQRLDEVLQQYYDRKEGREGTTETKEEVEEKKLPDFVVDYLHDEIGRKVRFGHYLKFRKALIEQMITKGDLDKDFFKSNKKFSNKVLKRIDRLFFNATYTLQQTFSDYLDGDPTVRINRLEYLTVKILLDVFTQRPPASKQEMHESLAIWMAKGWKKAAENKDIYLFIKKELRELIDSHKNNQPKKSGGKKKPKPEPKKTSGTKNDTKKRGKKKPTKKTKKHVATPSKIVGSGSESESAEEKTKKETPKTVAPDIEIEDAEIVDTEEGKTAEKKTTKSEREKAVPKETTKKAPKETPKETTTKETSSKELTPEQREEKKLDDYYKKIEKAGLKIGDKTRKATRSYTYLQEGKSATFNIVDEGYPGNNKIVITPAGKAFTLEDGGLKEKEINNISPLSPEYAWTGELWEKKMEKHPTPLEEAARERVDSPDWLNSAYFEGADKAYLQRFTQELKDAVDTAAENYPDQNMFKAIKHQLAMNGLGAVHFWNKNLETLDEFLPLEVTNELRDILAARKSWRQAMVVLETKGKRPTELKEQLLEDLATGERYHDRFVGESLREYIEQIDSPSSYVLTQVVGDQVEQVDTATFERQEFIDTCMKGAIKEHAQRLQEKEGTYRLSPEQPTEALIEQLSDTHKQRIDAAMKARMMSRDEYLQKSGRIKRLKQKKLRAENIFSKGWASVQLGTAKFFKGIQHRLLSIGKKKEKSSEAHAAEKVYPTDARKLFSSYTHNEENTALSQKLGLKNIQIVPGEDGKLQAKLSIGKKNLSVSLPEEKLYQGDELFKQVLSAKQLKDDQEKIAASWGLLKGLIMSITHKHGAIHGTAMNRELTIRAETGSVEVWIDSKRTFTEEQFLQLDPHEALEEVMIVWRMLQGAMEDQYEQVEEHSEAPDIGIDRRARKKLQADLLDEYDTLPRITVGTKQVEKTVEKPENEEKEKKEKKEKEDKKKKEDSSDKSETGEGDSEETKEEKSEEKKNSKEKPKKKKKPKTKTVSVSEYAVPPLTEKNQSLNYFVIEDGVSGDERVVYSDGSWYRIKGADSAPEVVEEYKNLQALFASDKLDKSTFLNAYTSNYLKHYFKLPRNSDRTVYFSHYGRRFQVKQTGSRGEFAVEVVAPTDELVGLAEEMPVYPKKRRRRNQPHRSENTAGFQYADGSAQVIAIDNKDSEGHVRYTEKELTDDEKIATKTADLGMFGSYPLTETLIATCNMTLRL